MELADEERRGLLRILTTIEDTFASQGPRLSTWAKEQRWAISGISEQQLREEAERREAYHSTD